MQLLDHLTGYFKHKGDEVWKKHTNILSNITLHFQLQKIKGFAQKEEKTRCELTRKAMVIKMERTDLASRNRQNFVDTYSDMVCKLQYAQ